MNSATSIHGHHVAAVAAMFGDGCVLVAPERAHQVESCLRAVALHPRASEFLSSNVDDDFWPAEGTWEHAYRPYVVKDGVLQIPVKGVLLHNFAWALGSWATGYKYIQRAFERGLDDPNVKGIALVFDSPGGQVAGCFELVDRMYERRREKPIRAFAADHAYSAAYAIASVGQRLSVTRSGGVGSVGVVTAHVDVSKALDDEGVKITFIFAGKHKVDGNSYEPLPDDVKARIQERIDETYGVFVATVARNRGLTEKEVRATEALTFTATQAVSEKFADAIGSFDDAIAEFSAEVSAPNEESEMTKENPAVDQAAIDAARAEGRAEGVTAGRATGVTESRDRIAAIFALDEAKNRKAAAHNIALTTDLSVEQAKSLLAALPEDKAASGKTPFDEAMSKGNPELGAGGTEKEDADSAEGVLADARGAGLPGLRRRVS